VRLWRLVGYLAVLRPIVVLGAIVTCLPLTTLPRVLAGTMVGNLFVEYGFWQAFWFGAVLLGAVWSLMFLAALSLDAARDRSDRWVYDPEHDPTAPTGARSRSSRRWWRRERGRSSRMRTAAATRRSPSSWGRPPCTWSSTAD
jgi:hypothetical protein